MKKAASLFLLLMVLMTTVLLAVPASGAFRQNVKLLSSGVGSPDKSLAGQYAEDTITRLSKAYTPCTAKRITEDEAHELILESFTRYYLLQFNSPHITEIGTISKEISESVLSYHMDSATRQPSTETFLYKVNYFPIPSEQSEDEIKNLAANKTVDDWRRFYAQCFNSQWTDIVMTCRRTQVPLLQAESDGTVVCCGIDIQFGYDIIGFGKMEAVGDGRVTVETYLRQNTFEYTAPMLLTVNLTRTADGWRVSGGSLYEFLQFTIPSEQVVNYSPYTGDTLPAAAGVWFAAAMLSLAVPASLAVITKNRLRGIRKTR